MPGRLHTAITAALQPRAQGRLFFGAGNSHGCCCALLGGPSSAPWRRRAAGAGGWLRRASWEQRLPLRSLLPFDRLPAWLAASGMNALRRLKCRDAARPPTTFAGGGRGRFRPPRQAPASRQLTWPRRTSGDQAFCQRGSTPTRLQRIQLCGHRACCTDETRATVWGDSDENVQNLWRQRASSPNIGDTGIVVST